MNDRTHLLLECGQRYGQCFKIKVFSQQFTIILSHVDWTTVVRNPSLKFMGIEFGIKIFGMSNAFRGKNDGMVSKWISTGLLKFSHQMLYQPSTLALLGEIDPASLENDFSLFDNKFHYFLMPFPEWIYSWFFSREIQARTRLNRSWVKNRNPLGASKFHQARLALWNNNSEWLSDSDYGSALTGFFWASLGNTIPAVFWSLFYILQSAINEAIRLVGTHFMTRKCTQQTEINLPDERTITIQPDETLTCVAMLLQYMKYKLEDAETIPSQVRSRIGVGIAPPNKNIPILYRYKI